ncbi:uncharacterized protein BDR25DRAFT_395479 [Lindgomyces ingoldianus]|uniref:Uncharacterized protein n=1 Tax=Lindgomyces ingoldianus TaxID=673940 RepID=A0ACB6QLD7_9PLEO|nr:uncharacterized protein BDR25DRAFT_395479 [Lindgomyces ingoldianus]KAF2466942.1 hypothetical protein BDR25DRAFT_395479 [Lindgomyces ingoldianus]
MHSFQNFFSVLGCWILVFLSVVISWTFSPSLRRQDTITLNLVFTLLYPLIAASYSIYKAFDPEIFSPANRAPLDYGPHQVSASATFASSLALYETYALLAPILMLISEAHDHCYRSISVFAIAAVGLFGKTVLLLKSPEIPFNTLRPIIFSELWAVMGLLMISILIALSFQAIRKRPIRSFGEIKEQEKCSTILARTLHIPIFYIAYAVLGYRGLWIYDRTLYQPFNSLLFIPGSFHSILDLKQGVVFGAGILNIGWTLYEAFWKKRREVCQDCLSWKWHSLPILIDFFAFW